MFTDQYSVVSGDIAVPYDHFGTVTFKHDSVLYF